MLVFIINVLVTFSPEVRAPHASTPAFDGICLEDSHAGWNKMVSYSSFRFYFHTDKDCSTLKNIKYTLSICVSSFEDIRSFANGIFDLSL